MSRGLGCGPCRRPILDAEAQRSTQDGLSRELLCTRWCSCCPSPISRGVKRLDQLALVLKTRLHVAELSAGRKGFKKESKVEPQVGQVPACGWLSLLTSGLDGSLLWGQSRANPCPGVMTSCLLVDGRQQQERVERKVSDVRRNAGPGDPTFREKLFGTCSPGLRGATGKGGVLGLGG